ncbi:putative serine/threonine-protein kinase [Dorcoceras hygrometricum]|uniref:Putative serine/threonine-protein kinase n=1 Tax=Dorcoceras hygrometricum TaxID=472368 RepID=A0A2Z7CFC6_9LAMI|nr:putative serine/threonine-protein kinase [Dorcoceras hygrometricum]
MGCVSSTKARSDGSPAFDASSSPSALRRRRRSGHISASAPLHSQSVFGPLEKIKEEPEKEDLVDGVYKDDVTNQHFFIDHSGRLQSLKRGTSRKRAPFSFKFGRWVEGEQLARWPTWLSAVAGEAIEGWMPLRSDSFERFEKIGQGTYSHVYRALNVETGKMVALKKVRFDNFQPDSVRFMAREISILRKLHHPNVMKLEGIITSKLSYSLYLVFEYMEHDLSGLLSCPDIKFTDSQIKCYMRQLLNGVEHCHSRGIMHRDIKSSNILINNQGILKIADFGLANFLEPENEQPLTSRVVTLWYRPPELLLGSTNYREAVDLWSIGCVFAEFFSGRAILKGRTEVEQLHKIFKLCGSPPEDYWKKCKLPLAAMFKPQIPYESMIRERCKEFPRTAVSLIETLLSVEPDKRGTAAYALNHEYFCTKPRACDPSSLPRYPPNKEIDAKFREEAKRKKDGAPALAQSGSRNPRRVHKTTHDFSKVVPSKGVEANFHTAHTRKGGNESRMTSNKAYDTMSEASQMTQESHGSYNSINSVPAHTTASNGFEWVKRRKKDMITRLHVFPTSRSQKEPTEPSSVSHVHDTMNSDWQENDIFFEPAMNPILREQMHLTGPDSFVPSDVYESKGLPVDYVHKKKKGSLSGPLLYQAQETASRQYGRHGHVLHRSRFYQDS